MAKVTDLGLAGPDDPIFKRSWYVGVPQTPRRKKEPDQGELDLKPEDDPDKERARPRGEAGSLGTTMTGWPGR